MTLRPVRPLFLALLVITITAASVCAAEPDPAVLSYKLPADLKWSESTAYPGLKNTVLYGDPDKPGPYAVRNRFSPGTFSRPHFHPNDRFIVVVSGTWWVGTGEKFDPESTSPCRSAVSSCTMGARSTTMVPRPKSARSSSTAWARRLPRASAGTDPLRGS
jgi:hypothetical protein